MQASNKPTRKTPQAEAVDLDLAAQALLAKRAESTARQRVETAKKRLKLAKKALKQARKAARKARKQHRHLRERLKKQERHAARKAKTLPTGRKVRRPRSKTGTPGVAGEAAAKP